MIVGYVSELGIRNSGTDFDFWLKRLVTSSVNNSLDYLIISGGISNNYHITLSFIEELGRQLKGVGTKLRFIVGNTDFYYPLDEYVVDKVRKFKSILNLYRNNPYYLPRSPIISRRVRIVGSESWYDYSLYRGKPRDLKDITKKRYFIFSNKDNKYITDPMDYTLGFENLFDIKYSKECIDMLRQKLESDIQKHGVCDRSVVITYFKGSKTLLGNSPISKYMGAFEGSLDIGRVIKSYRVDTCIVGKKSSRVSATVDGVLYFNPALRIDSDNAVEVVIYE